MLHIISTRDGQQVLLERINQGDALLFIQSAVLNLQKNSQTAQELLPHLQHFQCYALEADLLARGLAEDGILVGIGVVDYPGFVNLTVAHPVIKTWS